MATQAPPSPLTVVPAPGERQEVERTLQAKKALIDTIEGLKRKNVETKTKLAQDVASDLATGPLNVDTEVKRVNDANAAEDGFQAKARACEELLKIVQNRIEEFKTTKRETLRIVLQNSVEDLEKESATQQHDTAILQKQINEFKALLKEIEKYDQKQQSQ
jgi:hypothetical protein